MPAARAHVWISGLVQGVNFRYYTRQEAARHGLTGWVRNLPGGRVEAVFEGERESVQQLVDWCRRGPPSAEVTQVEVEWEEPKADSGSFRITL
jgi:acylphosphatase